MSEIDGVVVIVTPRYGRADESGECIAAFSELGLFAYGDGQDQALVNLQSLFRTFIRRSRESGVLEDRLNKSGLRWHKSLV